LKQEMILTVIGGGSVNWMPGLMKDIYLINEVSGGEIRLVDPNVESAELIKKMLEKFNVERNKSYKISVFSERKEALAKADFVLLSFSPGSLDSFYNDLERPIRYGIRQPVSMTVGPSGISASLRIVPEVFKIVQEMEKLCPNAWLLNVANPMSTVTKAMHLASSKIKSIGLCHEFHSFGKLMPNILNIERPEQMELFTYLYEWLPENGFEYKIAGLNHFIWLTEARLRGKDVLPDIRRYCANHRVSEDVSEEGLATSAFNNKDAAKFALCRRFGYLPLVGDRHLVEFFPSMCNARNGYGLKYEVLKTTIEARELLRGRQKIKIKNIINGSESVDWKPTGEEFAYIIKSIITGKKITSIINYPNRGQIANLPAGAVVETLAAIDGDNISPMDCGELPSVVQSICQTHISVQELTVKAALNGDRDILLQAMTLDPLCGISDFDEIEQMTDDLLEANKKWLPQFN
jgi:alpha-galactosidase/6-phospho-beta-glucosidase family protein